MRSSSALIALALLAGGLSAQQAVKPGQDPRDLDDPRDVYDPREVEDPRAVDEFGEEVADPRERPPLADLVEVLLEREDYDGLARAVAEDAWTVLEVLNRYRDRWMTLHESGHAESPAGMLDAFEVRATADLLARSADAALRDTRFGAYVDSVHGWDAQEQAGYRELRDLYTEGVTLMDEALSIDEALEALTPLSRALQMARDLGDAHDRALVLEALGQLQAAAGMTSAARASLLEAVEIGRSIRDLDTVWDALETLFQISLAEGDRVTARSLLEDQYLLAFDVGDEEVTAVVMDQLEQLDDWFDARDDRLRWGTGGGN